MARVVLPGHRFSIWEECTNLGNYPSLLSEYKPYFSQGIVWKKSIPASPENIGWVAVGRGGGWVSSGGC